MDNPYAPPSGTPGDGPAPGAPQGQQREPQGSQQGPQQPPHGPPGPPHGRQAPPARHGRRHPTRRRPATPPPDIDPDDLRVVNRRVRTFVLLVVAALVTSTFRLPWQLGGLVFAAAALGVGVAALVAARKPGLRQQVAPLILVGLVFTGLMAASMSTTLLLWSAQVERQECLSTALTIGARQACENAYEDAVEERLSELSGRTP